MVSIPKFSLNKATIKTEAELQKKLAEQGSQFKYLEPGKHDTVIAAITYEGPAKDPNWGNFKMTLEGLGKKTTTAFLLVPVSDIEYTNPNTGKKNTFVYRKFVSFMSALGVAVTVENLQDVLNENFSKPEKTLVGRSVTIDLGYDGNYIKYAGKDEAGLKMYNIVMADKSTLADSRGVSMVFSDFDAAQAHAEANQIQLQRYASVLEYSAPANLKKVSGGKW